MKPNYKPMLCAPSVQVADLPKLTYPLYCSPKYDGMRAIITPMGPRTRALKPIGNLHVRKLLNTLPVGLDGELVAMTDGKVDFRKTQSACRKSTGEPDFKYIVFDDMRYEKWTFPQRFTILCSKLENMPTWVEIAPQDILHNASQVEGYYETKIAMGFEGIIMRSAASIYKHGRSTLNEQYLMRMKPLESDEGVVVGVEEEMENWNDPIISETGYQRRSSKREGKYRKGQLGALVVRSNKWASTFKIGTGITEADRIRWWKDKPIGRVVSFEYDPSGGYDQPRSPRFKGFRDVVDLVEKV